MPRKTRRSMNRYNYMTWRKRKRRKMRKGKRESERKRKSEK